ncbi:MAG: O-acetyl-ADP-ribose deacetylase [Ruminococcaceae bacterium]|nr:O-acetyl-ADP-ribose deacetylase [Oscillospiraceae bacterium]
MPISFIRQDITKVKCDAIVNAANSTLLGGGGVDGAIHRAAGPELLKECRTLGGCETGEAKITGAYNLPCKYVIHTVGPIWDGGAYGEKQKLESCYRNSLRLAVENNCESVAFPLISSGVYGYPKDRALEVAVSTVSDFLKEHELTVYIVFFDSKSFEIGAGLVRDIQSYIDDNYVDIAKQKEFYVTGISPRERRSAIISAERSMGSTEADEELCESVDYGDIGELVNNIDESFSQMLLRKIDEKGMTDSECYKRANIDRKLFSKIRNDMLYKPRKTTALAFAIALELSLEDTKSLLEKAGYALSRSNKFDVIVEYFIRHKNYNIFEINEALFYFDQSLLGV